MIEMIQNIVQPILEFLTISNDINFLLLLNLSQFFQQQILHPN